MTDLTPGAALAFIYEAKSLAGRARMMSVMPHLFIKDRMSIEDQQTVRDALVADGWTQSQTSGSSGMIVHTIDSSSTGVRVHTDALDGVPHGCICGDTTCTEQVTA